MKSCLAQGQFQAFRYLTTPRTFKIRAEMAPLSMDLTATPS